LTNEQNIEENDSFTIGIGIKIDVNVAPTKHLDSNTPRERTLDTFPQLGQNASFQSENGDQGRTNRKFTHMSQKRKLDDKDKPMTNNPNVKTDILYKKTKAPNHDPLALFIPEEIRT
jgi:hypothetical protein